MQISTAFLSLAFLGAVASAQEVCSNADGTATTRVINNTCGCPGPTTTVFANTVTETSTADCHGCFDIVATTTRVGICLIACVGDRASATATRTIYTTPTSITEFICSPTP